MSKNMTWDERLAIMEAQGFRERITDYTYLAVSWETCAVGEVFSVPRKAANDLKVGEYLLSLGLPELVAGKVIVMGGCFFADLCVNHFASARRIYNELKAIKEKYCANLDS